MINLLKQWYRRNFSAPGTVEFAMVLIACFVIVYYFMWLVGPLVVALCFAYVIDWGVEWVKKRFHMNRNLAASIIMMLFVGVCVGVMVFIAPRVVKQGTDFYNALVLYSQDTMQQNAEEDGFVEHGDALSGNALDAAVARKIYSFVETMPDPLPTMLNQERIENCSRNMRTALMSNTAQILKDKIMPSVVNVMSWAVNLIIVPIFIFLMLLNKQTLQRRMLRYVLPSDSALIHRFWPKLNSMLHSYVNGSLMHILISGLSNCALFWAFGLNYTVLLGIGMGFSVVIPYVGAVLVGVPVLLFGALQFGFTSIFFWFVGAWLVLQLLDSYVLTPMLFSKTMDLDAFSILSSILIFGTLWGFWGVVFSIPLARLIDTLISQWPRVEPDPGVEEIKILPRER